MEEDNDFLTLDGNLSEQSLGDTAPLGEGINEVIGTLVLPRNNWKHVVLSESWPSLGFSLLNAGSRHVGLFLFNSVIDNFLLSLPDDDFFSFTECLKLDLLDTHSTIVGDFYWVQGSKAFTTWITTWLTERQPTHALPPCIVSLTPDTRRSETQSNGPSLAHSRVGGGDFIEMEAPFFFA